MVSRQKRKRMVDFIIERLENSNLYNIRKSDDSGIFVVEKHKTKNPIEIFVYAHNYETTEDEITYIQNENGKMGYYIAHVFFKDDEKISMVRLGRRGNIKDDRSLKHYTKSAIDAMIHLRRREKTVLGFVYLFPAHLTSRLTYYQPETERLLESIRTYEMVDVRLDYSHLEQWDPGYGFARNTISEDYKIAEEIVENRITSEDSARLDMLRNNVAIIVKH